MTRPGTSDTSVCKRSGGIDMLKKDIIVLLDSLAKRKGKTSFPALLLAFTPRILLDVEPFSDTIVLALRCR